MIENPSYPWEAGYQSSKPAKEVESNPNDGQTTQPEFSPSKIVETVKKSKPKRKKV